jgi:hypothetical protein
LPEGKISGNDRKAPKARIDDMILAKDKIGKGQSVAEAAARYSIFDPDDLRELVEAAG